MYKSLRRWVDWNGRKYEVGDVVPDNIAVTAGNRVERVKEEKKAKKEAKKVEAPKKQMKNYKNKAVTTAETK